MFGMFTEYKFDNRKWDIKNRYGNISVTSKYASQCLARDKSRDERVLIKKILCDKDDELKKAFKEVILLKRIVHENVIELVDLYTKAKSLTDFKEFYIVTNHMDTTLRDVIKTQKLKTGQIQFLTYQILRGLKYLHSMDIILKNLKPSTIAINENMELRIQDFNFSNESEDLCSYANRCYKAPELLLKCDEITAYVDMWSLGCILFELHSNEPLFMAKDVREQLNLIFQMIPEDSDIKEKYIKRMNISIENEKTKNSNNLSDLLTNIDNDAKVFIEDCLLKTDAESRYTSKQALEEVSFVSEFHDSDDEPEGEQIEQLNKVDGLNILTLKSMLYKEINSELI